MTGLINVRVGGPHKKSQFSNFGVAGASKGYLGLKMAKFGFY